MSFKTPKARGHSYGFTLVELLIVIVVMAILAAIVVTTYGGVQRNARNVARVENAKQYQKILLAYYTTEGGIPDFWGSETVAQSCFSGDLPDLNSDGVGECASSGGSPLWPASEELIAAAETVVKVLPKEFPEVTGPGGIIFYSPVLGYSEDLEIDGGQVHFVLTYFLEGEEQDCIIKPLKTSGAGYTYNHSDKFTASAGGVTFCYIGLPQLEG